MKYVSSMVCFGLFALCACNQTNGAKKAQGPLQTQKDKVSYSIGMSIGRSFKQQDLDLDLDRVRQGIVDGQSGAKGMLTDSQMQSTMAEFQGQMMAKMDSLNQKKSVENLKKSQDFLAQNGKAEGVKTTASGLEYKVLKSGTSKVSPKATDTVTVDYVGTLLDGTEFDSSIKRGTPATFPVSGVIPGWTEALQLMHTGDKFKLFIPPNLAYGEHGAGQQIPPNSTLVFEVELLAVNGKK